MSAAPDAARPSARTAALGRRYLRLLRYYPPGQREEMLGVLLATARPGQHTPGVRQSANLVACGLVIRARMVPRWLAGDPGQNALAVVSLIAPALMLIVAAVDLAVQVRGVMLTHHIVPVPFPFWQPYLVLLLGGPAAVVIGWLAVLLLGIVGRRRPAAAIASLLLALTVLDLLTAVVQLSDGWTGGLPVFLTGAAPVVCVVMASLAACSLTFSAGPRRGLAIAGRRAGLVIAGLCVGFGFPEIFFSGSFGFLFLSLSPYEASAAAVFTVLCVLAVAVSVAGPRARSTVGGPVAMGVTTGLLLSLSVLHQVGSVPANLVSLCGSLLFTVLVWPVVIASWRRRVRRARSRAH